MIKNLISNLFYLLKALLKVKKIILLITTSFLVLGYYANKKFNKKTKPELFLSIDVTTKPFLSRKSQIELILVLSNIYKIPQELMNHILYNIEFPTTCKNLLFLNFYQKDFIDEKKIETKPFLSYYKEIEIDSNLTATFCAANPFKKKSKDIITIKKNENTIIISDSNKYTLINQLYKKIIKNFRSLDKWQTLEECKAINNIFEIINTCKNIGEIEKACKNLLTIKSKKLYSILLQQLQIKAWHFWVQLKWDEETKKYIALATNKILLHPHFFNQKINSVLGEEKKYCLIFTQRTNYFNPIELNDILTNRSRYKCEKRILGEKISYIYGEIVGYPLAFIAIQKYNGPLKMY